MRLAAIFVRAAGEPRAAAREVMRAARLGDKVAAVATPVARALGLECIDPETKQLRPESRCAKRKQFLNGEDPSEG